MPFTTEQVATIRASWIPGDPPTDAELVLRSQELGSDSIYPVVIESLRKQLMLLVGTPASFTIPGDYGQNTAANITALEKLIADAEKAMADEGLVAGGTGSGVQIMSIYRKDPVRGGYSGPRPHLYGLVMPTPARIERATDAFAAVYRDLEAQVNAELARILTDPNQKYRVRRLRSMQREIERRTADLEAEARAFLNNSLPAAWRAGAINAGAGGFAWTQAHRQALGLLAEDNMAKVLKSTRFMSRDVKDLIRSEGSRAARLKVASGQTAVQAGRDLERRLKTTGITAVTYKDGRHIRASTYTEMLMRTSTALAYNMGAVNQMAQAGIRYVEVIDGADCGLITHRDGFKVNGKVIPLEVAAKYPISHPNCRRDFAARPDVDEATAKDAESLRPQAQRDDQAGFERYLKATAERRAAGRREPRQPRATRQVRSPRKPTTTPPRPSPAPPPVPRAVDPWTVPTSTREAEILLGRAARQIDQIHGVTNKFKEPFHADLSRLDVATAAAVAKEVRDFMVQNPGMRRVFNGITTRGDLGHPTAIATADPRDGMIRVGGGFENLEQARRQAEAMKRVGWWTSPNPVGVISHELGHILDFAAFDGNLAFAETRNKLVRNAVTTHAGGTSAQVTNMFERSIKTSPKMKDRVKPVLSEYGATNSLEAVAESLAEQRHYGAQTRPMATEIADGIRRLASRWVTR